MSSQIIDLRERSRKSLSVTLEPGKNLSGEQVQTGCLLRIADAVELMCRDREELERNAKLSKQLADQRQEEIKRIKKQRDAYKGKYESLKKQLEGKEGECTSEK